MTGDCLIHSALRNNGYFACVCVYVCMRVFTAEYSIWLHFCVKYFSKNTLKYYLSSFFSGYLYFTWIFFLELLLLLHYIPKENNLHFTLYIFPGTQKYLLHFECLAGHENCPIHALIKRTSLVIPSASDLADSLNTHASFVNYDWVLECALAIHK
jgi:hypothetical protein